MSDSRDPWTLTARWVFPVSGPPLARGTVTVEGEHIVAVEPHGCRAADTDLGNCAILPGLVNAHTHLDLTGMRGLAPPTPDFTSWLRQVIAYRLNRSPEQVQQDVQEGLSECLRHGTTCLGDISAQGMSTWGWAPLRSVIFHELLGLTRERADQAWMGAGAVWWGNYSIDSGVGRGGLSPHAPYSVHALLFRKVASRARHDRISVAIHLAETREELELLEHHAGPFVRFLLELGVWAPSGLVSGPDEVLRYYSGSNPVLFIHGNYLRSDSPIPPNATIVYCPRTHAAFGHPPHPFRDFLARGVRVALGTDSLASNPDLDLLAEARFLHSHHPDVPGSTVLRMATLSGAEALGWQDETGSLEPGKSADLVVLPLPDEERADPHHLILVSSTRVRSVLWRGRWVYSTG